MILCGKLAAPALQRNSACKGGIEPIQPSRSRGGLVPPAGAPPRAPGARARRAQGPGAREEGRDAAGEAGVVGGADIALLLRGRLVGSVGPGSLERGLRGLRAHGDRGACADADRGALAVRQHECCALPRPTPVLFDARAPARPCVGYHDAAQERAYDALQRMDRGVAVDLYVALGRAAHREGAVDDVPACRPPDLDPHGRSHPGRNMPVPASQRRLDAPPLSNGSLQGVREVAAEAYAPCEC
eukprot:CAMPEP_0179227036 /NCGR_PEP_ID=MMETSP0797-20121207/9116_1 /TAXON_ID=47934 /ORGANISM="Dinophysis acuminata, Strain DAEP01" /LENGTH=242 /DNA_ID=CAMNT_0020934071 /DNA_START=308 /DNA_END=1033 /DNA_ORIENTATION=+